MKKNKILIAIAIFLIIGIAVGTTYGFWIVNKRQQGINKITSACLNIELSDTSEVIYFKNAWPMTDNDGMNSDNYYSFKIKNLCDQDINYELGLDSIISSNSNPEYLNYNYVKVGLDSKILGSFSSLKDINNREVRASKELTIGTIAANEEKTHILRLWLDSETPIEEQAKEFLSKVFVVVGKGIKLPNKNVYAVGDISRNEECIYTEIAKESYSSECTPVSGNSVQYELTNDGVLNITGTGKIRSSVILSSEGGLMPNALIFQIVRNQVEKYERDNNITLEDALSALTLENMEYFFQIYLAYTVYDDLYDFVVYQSEGEMTRESLIEAGANNDAELFLMMTELDSSLKEQMVILLDIIKNVPSIVEINIAEGITDLGDYTLIDRSSATSYGHGVNYMLSGISNLEMLPKSGDHDEGYTYDVSKLTPRVTVNLPSTIETIGAGMFRDLYANINLSEGIKTINEGAFDVSYSDASDYIENRIIVNTVPSSVENIESAAFRKCKFMNEVNLTSIKTIGYGTFNSATFDKSFAFGNSLINIGTTAFQNSNLSGNLIIPSSITNIGNDAFSNTTLTSILIKKTSADGITLGSNWNGTAAVIYRAD